MSSQIIVNPTNVCPVCPSCKNPETYRVPRGFIFKVLMPFVPAKHFKCYRCFKKFYVFSK